VSADHCTHVIGGVRKRGFGVVCVSVSVCASPKRSGGPAQGRGHSNVLHRWSRSGRAGPCPRPHDAVWQRVPVHPHSLRLSVYRGRSVSLGSGHGLRGGGEKEQRHTAAAKHAQYRILLAWTVCVTWRESTQVAERVVLEGRGIAVGVASLQRARTCFSSTAKGLGRSTSFPTSSWFPICITN
jgi:hypothetical protein